MPHQWKTTGHIAWRSKKPICSITFVVTKKFFTKVNKSMTRSFPREDHLNFFEQEQQTSGYSPDERYEVDYYLERIRRSQNGGREQEVRNRRYAALKQLVLDGNYFSEVEMMQREPLLYEQLVGQYLTEKERKARDTAGFKNDSLVTILFNGIDRDNAAALRKEQENSEKNMEEMVGSMDNDDEDRSGENPPDSPRCSRAQWGNFDQEEEERQKNIQQELAAKKRNQKFSVPMNLLTSGERSLLRDEFIGMMYSKFISGEDDDFDYSKIDESLEYDNLDIVEQDEQERYFDTDDAEETGGDSEQNNSSQMQADDEEDDLDVYMRHIDQHLKNQKNMDQMHDKMRDVNCEYDSDG
ncbi:coiled-coil domain-containing protein 97 isoform X2 [Malaya genurostris]|uniref:coiled-coil domain-containing protein 97 isoform X2 n=1 Tax=Malaya genurostris TaxID=325434 RepID=UPI0026F39947|nr:coiled-coil domain-containing protein 97 isoform X2 [Malaya genurostris]